MQIKVENTAISNGVAGSVKDCLGYMKEPVLDYGAGKLRNSKFLLEQGLKLSVLDVENQVRKWSEEDKNLFEEVYIEELTVKDYFSTVLLTYVLNVVPEPSVREEILENIHSALKPEGKIIIEVRRGKGILSSKHIEPFQDGYLLGNGLVKTFQKPYHKEELIELAGKFFRVDRVVMKSDSIILVGVKR